MSLSEIPLEELTPRTQPGLSRLIVVSNREPYEHRHIKARLTWEKTSGGG